MKLFRRRRRSPLAPEAEAMIATAEQTVRMMSAAAAEFARVHGRGSEPETIHVDSERVDCPQLEPRRPGESPR